MLLNKNRNTRNIENRVLMVVTTKIFGHPIWDLIAIVNDATRYFISSSQILPLGLLVIKDYTFLELEGGLKVLFKGKVVDSPIVTAEITVRLDRTMKSLLYDIDNILGINCL